MDEVGKLIIQKPSAKVGASMSDLVMAWACDSDSGEPRYILELGPDRRGSMCRCECASCGLALIAVNAAKAEFVKRPHFRHPEGAERDECMVLAARAAVLRQLQLLGTIDLPRRQKSSTFRGLSGRLYEAWVERPATRLHISQVNFEDRATAVVTFDDGRRLRVELVGSIGGLDTVDGRGNPIPTVTLEVDDPAIAGMSPEDLRQRLELLPSAVCWRHHWDDETLKCEAAVAAHQAAIGSFDAVPDDLQLPDDLDPALKRETVLHLAVKEILAHAERLHVPGLQVDVEIAVPQGSRFRDSWTQAPDVLCVDLIDLERRFDRLVPDSHLQGVA